MGRKYKNKKVISKSPGPLVIELQRLLAQHLNLRKAGVPCTSHANRLCLCIDFESGCGGPLQVFV